MTVIFGCTQKSDTCGLSILYHVSVQCASYSDGPSILDGPCFSEARHENFIYKGLARTLKETFILRRSSILYEVS